VNATNEQRAVAVAVAVARARMNNAREIIACDERGRSASERATGVGVDDVWRTYDESANVHSLIALRIGSVVTIN